VTSESKTVLKESRPKRRFRFRFSLLSLILLISVSGGGLGFYTGVFQPLQEQWKAAEILKAHHATIETHPPHLYPWVSCWLPEGKRRNIKTVGLKREKWGPTYRLDDSGAEALTKLPYLEKLYLERAGVTDEQIEHIAKIKSIQRLSLWGNQITKVSIESLAKMPNLQVIDLKDNPVGWTDLTPFGKRPDIEVRYDHTVFRMTPAQVETLGQTGLLINGLILQNPTPSEVIRAIESLQGLRFLIIGSAENLPDDFVESAADHLLALPIRKRPVRIYLNDRKRFTNRELSQACKRFGSITKCVTVESKPTRESIPELNLPYSDSNDIVVAGQAVTLSLQKNEERCIVEFRFPLHTRWVEPDIKLLEGVNHVSRLMVCHDTYNPDGNIFPIFQIFDNVRDLELVTDSQLGILEDQILKWQSLRSVTMTPVRWNGGITHLNFLSGLKNLESIHLRTVNDTAYRVRDFSVLKRIPNLKSVMVEGENKLDEYLKILETKD